VLDGEDLGRGHDGRLVPRRHRRQRRIQCHGRLAAAHVALEEAGHRAAAGEVGPDFADAGVDRVGHLDGRCGGGGHRASPPEHHRQFHQEELAEDEPAAGLLHLLHGCRPMDHLEGRRQVRQAQALAHRLRQGLGHQRQADPQGLAGHPLEAGLLEALRHGVLDEDTAAGRLAALRNPLELRVL